MVSNERCDADEVVSTALHCCTCLLHSGVSITRCVPPGKPSIVMFVLGARAWLHMDYLVRSHLI